MPSIQRKHAVVTGLAIVLANLFGGCPGQVGPVENSNDNSIQANANRNRNSNGSHANSNSTANQNSNSPANSNSIVNSNLNSNQNSNQNSNGVDPNAAFTQANPLHVGSEAIIAGPSANPDTGFKVPDHFNVGRIALSGDGQYVWFYLFWDSVSTPPSDWLRLYRMHISAAQPERSLIAEEAEALGGGFLASNLDGSIAVFEMQRCEAAPVICRSESRFLKLTPGAAAHAFYDTENDAGLPSTTGVRLTNDGQTVFWHNNEHFWSAPTAGGGALELASVAHLNFYGPWAPFTGGQIFAFDITGDGGRWLLGVSITDQATNELRHELVSAAGALPHNTTGISRPSPATNRPRDVQWTDDGSIVGYCDSQAASLGAGYLLESSGAQDLNHVADPTLFGQNTLVLSDNGAVAFAFTGSNPAIYSGPGPSYFLDVPSRSRRPAGTSRFARPEGGVYGQQLSDNGQVMAGLWNARGIGTALNNVYVLRDGVDGLAGHPAIGEIWRKYDAASDTLVVRVKVTSTDGLERIYMLPFKNGLEPSGYVAAAQNPLYDDRWGGGVNFSTLFVPVAGQPDVYEHVISLRGKQRYLDSSFTARIIAVDATGTRTTFRDIALAP